MTHNLNLMLLQPVVRHENNRTACTTGTIVRPKSKAYGKKEDIPAELFKAGFIDECHLGFKQKEFSCFDIETTEALTEDDSREKAILSTLSISFASSLDEEPLFFVRQGDTLEDGKDLIRRFMTAVEEKATAFLETFPQKFQESLAQMAKIEAERRNIWNRKRDEGIPDSENKLELFPVAWKTWLHSMTTFRCYGFNSASFDTRVLAPQMFDCILASVENELTARGQKKPKFSVLKPGF